MKKSTDIRNRDVAIDGLKGIACLAVAFCWHYQHFGAFQNPPFKMVLWPFYKWGGCAVELFFMISGLMMSRIYDSRIWNAKMSFQQYFRRRIIKLWPIQLVTLMIVLVEELFFFKNNSYYFVVSNFDLYHFVLNVLMLQSGWFENSYSFNTPAWFVSTLLLMYIAFYIVCSIEKRINKRNDVNILIIPLILSLCGVASVLFKLEVPFFHYMFAARGFSCFFIGVVINRLANQDRKNQAICIGIDVLLIVIIIALRKFLSINLMQLICMLIGFPALIYLCIVLKLFKNALAWAPIQWLANYSMEIFMIHFPVQIIIALVVSQTDLHPYEKTTFFALYIITVLLSAYVLKQLIEYLTALLLKQVKAV